MAGRAQAPQPCPAKRNPSKAVRAHLGTAPVQRGVQGLAVLEAAQQLVVRSQAGSAIARQHQGAGRGALGLTS